MERILCVSSSAKDMKEKFSMLRFYGDSSPPASKDTKVTSSPSSSAAAKEAKPPKLTADVVVGWSKSFDSLLADKCMFTLLQRVVSVGC